MSTPVIPKTTRFCLRCSKPFQSTGKANRMCLKCRQFSTKTASEGLNTAIANAGAPKGIK